MFCKCHFRQKIGLKLAATGVPILIGIASFSMSLPVHKFTGVFDDTTGISCCKEIKSGLHERDATNKECVYPHHV